MHLQLRTIYFFSILLCFLDCTAKDVRLANPATPEEGAKQGVVAFGIYRVFKGSDLLKKLTFEKRAARDFLNIVEVTSVNDVNRTATFLNKPVVNDDSDFSQTKKVNLNLFYRIIIPDSNKKYAIESLTYIDSCGKNCIRTITCPFDIYESFKKIPIQITSANIQFLGIQQIDFMKASENEIGCYENNKEIKKGGFKPIFIQGEDSIKTEVISYLAESYYFAQRVEPKNAELKFLRDFIDIQKEGDWKIKAEERLAALGYKYENGFLIEVEAKKK
jgi:hypothetical protein